jgi:hypothetical protein
MQSTGGINETVIAYYASGNPYSSGGVYHQLHGYKWNFI